MSGELVPAGQATPQQSDRERAVRPVVDGLRELIVSPTGLLQDRPGFIQGGGPQDPFSNVVREITRFNCRRWAAADKQNFSPRVNTGNAALCSPYLQDLDEDVPGGEVGPAWEGGSCYSTDYSLTVGVTFRDASDGARRDQSRSQRIRGPLISVSVGENGGSPNRPTYTITANSVNSSNFQAAPVRPDGFQDTQTFAPSLGNAAPGTVRLAFVGLTVVSGSDDCGDGPPSYRPPPRLIPTTPVPPRITVNIPGLGPVNVNISNSDEGDPIICFEGVEVCVDLSEGGDGVGGGGTGGGVGGGDGLPGDPTAVGSPGFSGEPGQGGADVDFGEPPDGRVWVGAITRFVDGGAVGVIPETAGRNRAYTSVVGNLSLRYGAERGTARQVRSEWMEAFRPVTALVVTGAFVNSLPGVVVTVFPVSATICPEDTCGGEDG